MNFMIRKSFRFTDSLKEKIECYKWTTEQKPKAVIQIVHGMAEHAARYDDIAHFFVKNGFSVYANDHRGHGQTAAHIKDTGFFANKNGWKMVIKNIFQLTKIIKKENPQTPVFIIGHSMGSILVQNYISKYPAMANGVILSGASYNSSLLIMLGRLIANTQRIFIGRRRRSKMLNYLSFGSFNKNFKPSRTKFDWLSRDTKQVDAYIDDDFCGFLCTTSLYSDLFYGIRKIQNRKNLLRIPLKLPIFLISGEKDPVGNFTKGVSKIHEIYKYSGIEDVEKKFYKDSRHEILNEINKEEVYNDIINWINKRI